LSFLFFLICSYRLFTNTQFSLIAYWRLHRD
jgi:hypothetical protein